jgi:hypothetical protein
VDDAWIVPTAVRHRIAVVAFRRRLAPLALQKIWFVIVEPAAALTLATVVVFAQRENSSVEGKAGRDRPVTVGMGSPPFASTGDTTRHPAPGSLIRRYRRCNRIT